jgi:tRNA(adenine34) deaminase
MEQVSIGTEEQLKELLRYARKEYICSPAVNCSTAQISFMIEPSSNSISKRQVDEQYMRLAIDQARIAEENGDVPIGAVIVHNNQIIAKAYNQREIIALTQAAAALENWHLHDCTMYVTLEPCCMCAGALVLARINRLVYGCDDPKTGAIKSLYNIVQDKRLNHQVEVTSGVLSDECSALLQDFFLQRRSENKNNQ